MKKVPYASAVGNLMYVMVWLVGFSPILVKNTDQQ